MNNDFVLRIGRVTPLRRIFISLFFFISDHSNRLDYLSVNVEAGKAGILTHIKQARAQIGLAAGLLPGKLDLSYRQCYQVECYRK